MKTYDIGACLKYLVNYDLRSTLDTRLWYKMAHNLSHNLVHEKSLDTMGDKLHYINQDVIIGGLWESLNDREKLPVIPPPGRGTWVRGNDGWHNRVWKCEDCDEPADTDYEGRHLCQRCSEQIRAK